MAVRGGNPRGGRQTTTPKKTERDREPRPATGSAVPTSRPAADRREQICFAHDPAKGQKCSDSKCPRLRLDTAQSGPAERFEKAYSVWNRTSAKRVKREPAH